mgnify:CR=1 FL=1
MSTQQQATIDVIRAVADAIRNLGEVPSGHLYARLMGHVSLEEYTSIIGTLKQAGLISEQNYLLTWIGPKRRES